MDEGPVPQEQTLTTTSERWIHGYTVTGSTLTVGISVGGDHVLSYDLSVDEEGHDQVVVKVRITFHERLIEPSIVVFREVELSGPLGEREVVDTNGEPILERGTPWPPEITEMLVAGRAGPTTKKALLERARRLGVAGRSKMSRAELASAVEHAEAS